MIVAVNPATPHNIGCIIETKVMNYYNNKAPGQMLSHYDPPPVEKIKCQPIKSQN